MFQFQSGSIISRNYEIENALNELFQFQSGSIIRTFQIEIFQNEICVSIPIWFNYKKCSLNAFLEYYYVSIPIWFNYKSPLSSVNSSRKAVSIPIWFNYKSVNLKAKNQVLKSFNSNLVQL